MPIASGSGVSRYPDYAQKCARLLTEKDVRFAGIIDAGGQLLTGGQRDGLPRLEDDAQLRSFMEFVSRTTVRKEFDDSLGPINYLAARRDKAVLISFPFPVSGVVLLISAEPSVDIESMARLVVDVFAGVR